MKHYDCPSLKKKKSEKKNFGYQENEYTKRNPEENKIKTEKVMFIYKANYKQC